MNSGKGTRGRVWCFPELVPTLHRGVRLRETKDLGLHSLGLAAPSPVSPHAIRLHSEDRRDMRSLSPVKGGYPHWNGPVDGCIKKKQAHLAK